MNDLDSTFGNLLSHIDAIRNSDQVGILELHPRPLVAIVQKYFNSDSLQLLSDLGRDGHQLVVGSVGGGNYYLKGGNLGRQPEPIGIVALLDSGSQNAFDSDPVTSHDRHHFFAVAIEDPRSHRL